MKSCVFPGAFDPFTLGHLDIVTRALKIFDRVVIGVAESGGKSCMFSLPERTEIVKAAVKGFAPARVPVAPFSNLLVDFCKAQKVNTVVRGLRTASDLEYENMLSAVYKIQDDTIETVYFLNSQELSHIHSNMVRDLLRYKGDISRFVPAESVKVIARLRER